MPEKSSSYVYILLCSDGTYYTGYTTDVNRRVKEHNNHKGAKYTRGRTPCRLVYKEACKNKSEALSREYEIKKMSRKKKEQLIQKMKKGD